MKQANHSLCILSCLPSDLFSIIKQFVNLSNLFILSKKFICVRYDHAYLRLNTSDSWQYCKNSEFRRKVNSIIRNTNTQIALNCNAMEITNQMIEEINSVHHICCSFGNIVNWQCLINIQSVDLSFSNIEDVTILKNVRSLNLSHCNHVKDVSALGKVLKLQLSHCNNIRDVNTLGSVTELYINGCTGITDIGSLKNLQILHISLNQHNNVNGIEQLQKQNKIQIVYYS